MNGFFLKARELDWKPTFYCVEDHLVAEDRRDWINAFKGPIKFFPVYLAYCLQEDPDTIFYNHRPRKSFPQGFDFSTEADQITYTGGTVTFSCLQLAHYLGFEEIYLIGVDADYDVPKDTATSNDYGTAVLDMKSDDTNHFHPDYFGKGFRWHDPNVDRMVAAYEEARRVTDGTGRRIYNAGIGGKLEVFERRPLHTLFPHARSPEALEAEREAKEQPLVRHPPVLSDPPRCLILDHTRNGDGTATGELKAAFFEGWPADRLLQVHQPTRTEVAIGATRFTANADGSLPRDLLERIATFRPEVILYRPVPDTPALHPVAMRLIRMLRAPLVTWIMDDWPAHLASERPADFRELDRDWQVLLRASAERLSIGTEMAKAFKDRYGFEFLPFANGVDPAQWPRPRARPPGALRVRYAGSLAANMCLESVLRVAEATERLASLGVDITFEIKTRPLWHAKVAPQFAGLSRTSFFTDDLTPSAYREWLCDADVLVIAYNFDPNSIQYVRYSIANKLPECLASGSVILAHGPAEVATIQRLLNTRAASVVATPSTEDVAKALLELSRSPFLRLDIGEAAQELAFRSYNIHEARCRFAEALNSAAQSRVLPEILMDFCRDDHVHLDEVDVVARMLSHQTGPENVMIDVGAHFGNSAARFAELGWSIHCFEPDPSNREKLIKRLGKAPRVIIDPRAVGEESARDVALFTSPESTGISGLLAFHMSHAETGKVDVTTVSEVVETRGISRIDFLKIDVEGFDFNVLKGVPWNRVQPDIILCEFEDAKTLSLGHTWKEVARFLEDKGYAVYISEWHPIIRYGRRHDWRRIMPLRDAEMPKDAWGNILAFLTDPGTAAVNAAFIEAARPMKTLTSGSETGPRPEHAPASSPAVAARAPAPPTPTMTMTMPSEPATTTPVGAPQTQQAPSDPGLGRRMQTVLEFAGNVGRSIWRRRAIALPALAVWLAWMAVALMTEFADYRWLIWALGAYALVFAAIAYVALRVWQFMVRHTSEASALRQSMNTLRGELDAANVGRAQATADAKAAVSQLARDAEAIAAVQTRTLKLMNELGALGESIKGLTQRHDEQRATAEIRLSSLQAGLESLRELAAEARAATQVRLDMLETAVGAMEGELRAETRQLRQASATHDESAVAAETRIAELETQLRAELAHLTEAASSQTARTAAAEAFLAKLDAELRAETARLAEASKAHGEKTADAAAQIASFNDRANELSERLTDYAGKLARTEAAASFNNATWYQRFNRRLNKEHVEALLNKTGDVPVKLSQQTIGYMAHRVCVLEAQMQGRLATSIEDMLLRIFSALSVRGSSLNILEIGTLFGVGAGILYDAVAPHFDDVHVTLLDPLDGYYVSDRLDILTGQPVTEQTLWRNLDTAGLPREKVTLIKHLSSEAEALDIARKREYDVLVIDGDHSYDGVKVDFELYGPLVRKGGVIVFDDYGSPDWPDVKQYVDAEVAPRRHIRRAYEEWRTCVYRVVVPKQTMELSAELSGNATLSTRAKKPRTSGA